MTIFSVIWLKPKNELENIFAIWYGKSILEENYQKVP